MALVGPAIPAYGARLAGELRSAARRGRRRAAGRLRRGLDLVAQALAPFFLATAGLFGHAGGDVWGVGHYRLRPSSGGPA